MKVAYITTSDPNNILNWSGLNYYIAKSLKDQGVTINYIGPLKNKYIMLYRSKKLIYKYLFKKNYLWDREPSILMNYASQASNMLSQLKVDIVFSPGTIPIAYLKCDKPIAFWTDSNFAGMVDFYPQFSNLYSDSLRNEHKMETAALKNCSMALYSSEWAASTAMSNYQFDYSKVKVIPFGANVDCQRTLSDIETLIKSRPSNKCNLLFIGVDWKRKGGEVALKIAKELNKGGLKTELTIVGCKPAINESMPYYIKLKGFISKSTKDGREEINKLLGKSHFLILPSKADASPVVLCEANSFGVPCLTTDVGGIPSIIHDGINGMMFSRSTDISDYCNFIYDYFRNVSKYKELAISSFQEYCTRLNWRVSGNKAVELLQGLL